MTKGQPKARVCLIFMSAGKPTDWVGRIHGIGDDQTADPGNGLAETHQLLPVELVNPAEVVDDFGNGFAGVRVALVMGELEVFDDRAILVFSFCDS